MNKDTLVLELAKTPDLRLVGGNARHTHWASRHRAFQQEKHAWMLLVREQLSPPMPRFQKAMVQVTLYFKQRRHRDPDNLFIALKPLWDALCQWGILAGDDGDHLEVVVDVVVNKSKAPLTRLILQERSLA